MASTRKKLLISAICLVAIVAAVVFGLRPALVAYMGAPEIFDPALAGPEPDYADIANWVAHPQKQSTSKLMPKNAIEASEKLAAFYIHPTTYFGPGEWNLQAAESDHAAQNIEHVEAGQASAFSGCCEVYLPAYRQAHIAAFVRDEGTAGQEALEFAYADIARAFEEFLTEIGPDTPFFVASHSQGTLHLQRLLHERVNGTDLLSRIVAIYAVGYWMPVDMQERLFPQIPICATSDQTRCLVTYDSYAADRGGRNLEFGVPHWYPEGWEWAENKHMVCVNPLSWKIGDADANIDSYLGMALVLDSGNLIDFIRNRNPGVKYQSIDIDPSQMNSVGCKDDGSLLVDITPSEGVELSIGEGDGSLHQYDWHLFYMNLRQNIAERAAAFTAGG